MSTTADRVRELFDYDPETGVLTWKAGKKVAGFLISDGYRKVGIDGGRYSIHRVIWLHVSGHWPVGEIDHINGIRDDNRLINLRDVSRAENCQNLKKARGHSKTGVLGVSWHKGRKKFAAQIKVGGKSRHLGLFATPEEAHVAYLNAKRVAHSGCCI